MKLPSPGTSGIDGPRQLAAGGDQDVGLDLVAAGNLQPPAARLLVEGGTFDVAAETGLVEHAEAARDALEVGLDLVAWREASRPIGVGSERQRVQMRRDVAGGARIGVGAPDPAEPVAALEDHEVVDAAARELDGGGDATEAPSDDCNGHPVAMAPGEYYG